MITAVDGKDGLAKLQSDPGIKLVVADVNMPNMDGLTMVEKIRGELKNTSVNLIMLTTESSPNMKERGKAAGVKGWIVKPFKGPAVLETFKKLVARAPAADSRARTAAAGSTPALRLWSMLEIVQRHATAIVIEQGQCQARTIARVA